MSDKEIERLMNMKVHDKIELSLFIEVTRVIGGWIYHVWDNKVGSRHLPVFVPEPEFKGEVKHEMLGM